VFHDLLLQFIGELVGGQSLFAVLAIFCGLVLVGTTFISHTVGAMVILPIVQSVGDHMPGNHSKLLVMGAALMCSGGHGVQDVKSLWSSRLCKCFRAPMACCLCVNTWCN
jgi:di/tricarboxylate transporter